MKKILALVLALAMAFALCGCAGSDYKKAVGLYEAGDYEAAKEIFTKLKDYEDSELYARKAEVLLNPEAAIEAACQAEFDNDEKFWPAYNEFLGTAQSIGLATSGGKCTYETKYDEASKEFACLADIPFMKGNEIYLHYYFGFLGHIEEPEAVIDGVKSYEFSADDAGKFFSTYWKH